MTIYCQNLAELPLEQMARLWDGCQFPVECGGRGIPRYRYVWPDLTITAHPRSAEQDPSHLSGVVVYLGNVARARGGELPELVVKRVMATKLVLGFVVEPDYEEESRFERLQDLVATICYNTSSLLFWEGDLYDQNGDPVLQPPAGQG